MKPDMGEYDHNYDVQVGERQEGQPLASALTRHGSQRAITLLVSYHNGRIPCGNLPHGLVHGERVRLHETKYALDHAGRNPVVDPFGRLFVVKPMGCPREYPERTFPR